jgi:hypothetical protein
MELIKNFAPKLYLIVTKPVIVGWAIQLIDTALWIYGYFVTLHPSLIDWHDITPSWFADWLPNIEAEIGLALVIVGTLRFIPSKLGLVAL